MIFVRARLSSGTLCVRILLKSTLFTDRVKAPKLIPSCEEICPSLGQSQMSVQDIMLFPTPKNVKIM